MSFRIIPVLFFALLLTSCVSKRKYEDLRSVENRQQRELADLRKQLTAAENTVRDLNASQSSQLTESQQREQRLQTELANARNEVARVKTDIETVRNELSLAKTELARQTNQLGGLEQDLTARSQRIAELERAIQEKEARIEAIRTTIDRTLRGFSASDLTVREQDGKIYVSMSQDLLFPSGSKTINAKGKDALAQLAGALVANSDIAITVEGHTDSDGNENTNWDLSVDRAVSVLKELTKNGVDPTRIIASGRGEYFPVDNNETREGKARNRRTEIILTPKLDALYRLLN
ncbi:OmpA family protein [Lewinella sp. W8]|uniref:OmpA family protein n=1 Tax=Lewinella sp. W8 TaxID=2528208 RepID=UPI001067DA95|nr:OmpA family protein [Lewinella sp. W8]MTB51234.1 OmpA family protein [Lewinella sp. W8]